MGRPSKYVYEKGKGKLMSRTHHHTRFNERISKGKTKLAAMKKKYMQPLNMADLYIETSIDRKAFSNKLMHS